MICYMRSLHFHCYLYSCKVDEQCDGVEGSLLPCNVSLLVTFILVSVWFSIS